MLRAADALWNARAFDSIAWDFHEGWCQGQSQNAAAAIEEALQIAGESPSPWEGPIHPFDTIDTAYPGEPIATAQLIVQHTQRVVKMAAQDVELATREADGDALRHLSAARDHLAAIQQEFDAAPREILG